MAAVVIHPETGKPLDVLDCYDITKFKAQVAKIVCAMRVSTTAVH
jgi:hypothetical protein